LKARESDERKLKAARRGVLFRAPQSYNVVCWSCAMGLWCGGVVDKMLESRGCVGVAGDTSGV